VSGSKTKYFILTLGIWVLLQGCSSWFTIQLPPTLQPVYFGSGITPDTSADEISIETLSDFRCKCVHEAEEGSYSEGEHVSIELGGYDQIQDNIYSSLSEAFEDDSARFIADIQVEIGVRTGISLSNVIAAVLSSMITDNESNMGSYQTEFFKLSGTVYRIKDDEK